LAVLLAKKKVKLVARDDTQKEEDDFDKKFSPPLKQKKKHVDY
jgi:hypothetical protein